MKKRNPVSAILIALVSLLVFTGCTDPVFVESIKLDVSELSMVKGEEYTVMAAIDPEYVYYRELEWTVDREDVVTVDKGHITAVGNGSAVVTAAAVGGASASLRVTVQDVRIELDTSELTMIVGEHHKVNAVVGPEYIADRSVSWSVELGDAVTVDSTGMIEAVKPGRAVVKATHASGASASLEVSVDASSIGFTEDEVHLHKGDTHTLELVITPDYVTSRPVVWSVDREGIVSINDGVITANDNGEAVVTATVEGVGSASIKVSVHEAVIELDQADVSLVVGDKLQVNATVTPSVLPDRSVSWSVESGNAVTVDSTGLIEAVNAGDAVVIARHKSGAYAKLKVHVEDVSVTLETSTLSLGVGDTATVKAAVGPDYIKDKAVTWSVTSGDSVVVDPETGLITAEHAGTSVVTATHASGAEASVTVNVEAVTVTVDHPTLSLIVGDTYTVTAAVGPDFVADKTVKWAVAGVPGQVVTVSDGVITAVAPGNAVVTATHKSGASATVSIKVEAISVSFGVSEVSLARKEQIQLTPVVGPEFMKDKTLFWTLTSGDSVTVDSVSGLIAAVKTGDSVVTATHVASGKSASVTVHVKDVDIIAGRKPVADSIRDMNLENSESLKIAGTLSAEDFKALNSRSNLTSLDLSLADNRNIADSAFLNNSTLTQIVLPEGLTSIGVQSFAGTTALKSIVLPDTVKVISAGAFAYSWIEGIVLPEGLEEIQAQAFASCASLAPVKLPSTVKTIGDGAFQLTKLQGTVDGVLELPARLETVGSYAFTENSAITGVVLPESFKTMYSSSFPKNIVSYTFIGDVPPSVVIDKATTINGNAVVHVPAAAVETYKTSQGMLSIFDVGNIQQ